MLMGVLAMFRSSLTQVDLLWELVRLESLSDTWDELATIQNFSNAAAIDSPRMAW
jgi:hypothetical protein